MLKIFNCFILSVPRLSKKCALLSLLLSYALLLAAQTQGDQSVAPPRPPLRQRPSVIAAQKQKEKEEQDKKKGVKRDYSVFNGLSVSVDLFDPLAMAFGQSYGGYEVALEADFLNRFFPAVEFGLGRANNTPEDMNFTYVSHPAFYGRVGMNYNFNYKSGSPNYFYGGFRYGFTSFKYDITNISLPSYYWEQQFSENILDQHSYAHWMELVAGVRVNIYRNFSMGWSVRYKFMMKLQKNVQSSPWYVPGYGKENMPLGITYSIYYKFSIQPNKKAAPAVLKNP